MRRTLLAVAFLGFLAVPTANAQTEQVAPELAIGIPFVDSADGRVPLTMDGSAIVAPWNLTFPNAASAAAAFGGTNITMTWSLSCQDAELLIGGPGAFAVEFVPGQSVYSDQARLPVSALNSTPGVRALSCILEAQTSASAE